MGKCFALRQDGRCSVLTVKLCTPETCPFYKTEAKDAEDRNAAMDRLAAMDGIDQDYLSEKYFNGEKPWKGKKADRRDACQ